VRKLMLVVCAFAFTLSSCGRQVTPNRTGAGANGLQAGQMQIKVTTQGQLDFVNNWYVVPFNLHCASSPQNCEPYAINGTNANNWLNWDFELVVFQPNVASPLQTAFYQFVTPQSGPNTTQKTPVLLNNYSRQDVVVNPNCNGTNTQFCVTLNRRIFNGLPSTLPNPTPAPTNGPGGTWFVNWLVASPQGAPTGQVGQVLFAPGVGGLTDQTFQFPSGSPGIDVTTHFDQQWLAQPSPPWMQAGNAAAQITGGEVINNP